MDALTRWPPQPEAKNNFSHSARWRDVIVIESTQLFRRVHDGEGTKSNRDIGNMGPVTDEEKHAVTDFGAPANSRLQ